MLAPILHVTDGGRSELSLSEEERLFPGITRQKLNHCDPLGIVLWSADYILQIVRLVS